MSWSTLFNRRIVFDTIELTDWQMHVEVNRDGTQSFPKLTPRGPRGPSSWTTTLRYVRAGQGEFTYQDHNTPWGIVARNLDVTVARPGSEYVGQAKFSDGLTTIQGYVPFRTDMTSTFKIDGGRVIFDRINLETEGTQSVLEWRRQPVALPGADVPSEVDDRSAEDAGDLLRRRHVHADGHESVHRHVSSVQGAAAGRHDPDRP